MKRMRIALVSDAVLPFNKGGKETRIYYLTKVLKDRGFVVDVYTMQWWEGGKHFRHEGIDFHAISRFHPLYKGQRRSIWQAVCFAAACLKLAFYDYDVLEVDHMPYLQLFTTKFVSLLTGRPLYTTWHEVWGRQYWQEYLGGIKGRLASFVEKLSVRLSDHITAVSTTTYERLVSELGYTGSLTLVINGIDLQRISSLKPAPRTCDIIYAGRLVSHKNVDVLLRAIARLKGQVRLSCLIIGDGPESARLRQLAVDLGLDGQVTFTGFLETSDEVLSHIKSSRVYVLPSIREGFGISILEAMACKSRVITIDHPDNAARLLVPSGAGSVIRLDEGELADAILAELAKSDLDPADGTMAGYDWSNSGQILSEVYSS